MSTNINNNNNTSETKSEGMFSWLSSFLWDSSTTTTVIPPPSSKSTDVPMVHMINDALPPLPFKYNPTTRHILLFNGNFSDETSSPIFNHGFSIVSCTDLDYQFFKYFGSEEMKGAFIHVPQSEDKLDDIIELFPVAVDQFLTHIKTVSSEQPEYEVVNNFLEFDSLYQYFGGDRFIDWWFDGLNSKDPKQREKIQELKKVVNIHGKKYYPDYF